MARKKFEGRDVAGVQLKVTQAVVNLDGPSRFQVGDVVHVVAEAVVDRVGYTRLPKGSDAVVRVEHAIPLTAALVDSGIAQDAIDLARIADEAMQGIMRLGDGEGDDA